MTDDFLDRPAAHLTAHQPPALLVDRPLALADRGGRVALVRHPGFDGLQLCEAAAQALAVIMGCRLRRAGAAAARASGMLVGVRDFVVHSHPAAGAALEATATMEQELGDLQLYRVVVHTADGAEIVGGAIKTYTTPDAAGAEDDAIGLCDPIQADTAEPPAMCPISDARKHLGAWRLDDEAAVVAQICYPVALPVFRGHFPGNPLVPGVYQLGAAVEAARRGLDRASLVVHRLVKVKWTAPALPGQMLGVAVRWRAVDEGWRLDAQIAHGGTRTCVCTLIVADEGVGVGSTGIDR